MPSSTYLDRVQAHAIRLAHAITAAFANRFIDDYAQYGLSEFAAGPLAALLGRAELVIDDDGHSRDEFQLAHDFREGIAIA